MIASPVPRHEASRFAERGSEQGLPGVSEAESFPLIAEPQIKTVPTSNPFSDRGCMHPEAAPALMGFHVNSGQSRSVFNGPAAQQQRGLFTQIGASLRGRSFG